jgi:hypothetical protein
VHDRMTVMLLPEDYDAWLGSMTAPEDLRNQLQPYDESLMEASGTRDLRTLSLAEDTKASWCCPDLNGATTEFRWSDVSANRCSTPPKMLTKKS